MIPRPESVFNDWIVLSEQLENNDKIVNNITKNHAPWWRVAMYGYASLSKTGYHR